jgi:hypothetical protein
MNKAQKIELVSQIGIEVNKKITETIALLRGEGLPEDSNTLKKLADKMASSEVVNSITQDDINTAIQEAFGEVGLTIEGANLANLGNVIAIETEYANMPTTDQLGNELSSNDLSVLLEDDGDNKAGIYQWDTTNTRWNRLNLNFGGGVDEPVTQEEVNQALE